MTDDGADSLALENGPGYPELSEEACSAYLMEPDWVEGFNCVLRPGHIGVHVCRSWVQAGLTGTDSDGLAYRWAYVWEWQDRIPHDTPEDRPSS